MPTNAYSLTSRSTSAGSRKHHRHRSHFEFKVSGPTLLLQRRCQQGIRRSTIYSTRGELNISDDLLHISMSPSLSGFALRIFAMRVPIYVRQSSYGIPRTPISTPGPTRCGRLTARRNRHHTSELRVTPSPHMLSAFLLDCFLCFHRMPLPLIFRPHSLHISIYARFPPCSRPLMRIVYASYRYSMLYSPL